MIRNGLAFALLGIVGAAAFAGSGGAQTEPSTSTTDADRGDRSGSDGVQGAADPGPSLTGIIVGLIFVGLIALFFVAYLRYRD